jgi:hypothetical protein
LPSRGFIVNGDLGGTGYIYNGDKNYQDNPEAPWVLPEEAGESYIQNGFAGGTGTIYGCVAKN